MRLAAEASLRRLGMDTIDLYQLHQPDPEVPIAETLGAMAELVREGKVREIGCSNFSAEQLRESERAVSVNAPRFVSVQNEYSLVKREPEQGVLDECVRQGLAFIPYFPLASGLLTGKYRTGQLPERGRLLNNPRFGEVLGPRHLRYVDELTTFAEARRHSVLDLAFAWLLARPAVASVIAGATSPEQVRLNVAAGDWELGREEADEVPGF